MKTEIEIKDKTKQAEGLKVAPFRKHIRKTKPHKHNNYFEIIYLTKGQGTHTIDTKVYPIKPPVIFIVRKEQVHFWDINTEPEGFVAILKKQYVENHHDLAIKHLLTELSTHQCMFPHDADAIEIFELLVKQMQAQRQSSPLLIDGLLKALLAKLLEARTAGTFSRPNRTIFQHFIDLLSVDNQLKNSVHHYAQQLNTTPQNLNTICRKETGQSASELVAEHIISEAKRLLIYTDHTISEIASKFEFKDNSHFSKYFKRHVGVSPLGFRNEK